MPQKKATTRTTEKKPGVKVQDLAAKKDAKGGGHKVPGSPDRALRGARFNG